MKSSKIVIACNIMAFTVLLFLGFFICLIFGIVTAVTIAQFDKTYIPVIILLLIFDLLGVGLIVLAVKCVKLLIKNYEYEKVLANVPNGSIPALAAMLGAKQEDVYRNLDLLIRRKYFPNAYIDLGQDRIVFPGMTPIQNEQAAQPAASAGGPVSSAPPVRQAPKVEMVSVTCKSCGGINSLPKGSAGECEYCGSPIRG